MPRCLLILGMHRSGTSAVSGALHTLGVPFGDHLMAARAGDNERGFFEDLDIYAIHSRLFDRLGYSWDDPRILPPEALHLESIGEFRESVSKVLKDRFHDQPLFAVKDPRISVFVPFWLAVLDQLGVSPRFLIAVRHPAEVAASLARRNGFGPEKSACLWLHHNLAAEIATRAHPRAFVFYPNLLDRPVPTLAAIGQSLGVDWPHPPEALADELQRFLSAELRHHVADASPLPTDFGRFGPLVERLYGQLADADRAPNDDLQSTVENILSELHSVDLLPDPMILEHIGQQTATLREQALRFEERVGGDSARLQQALQALGEQAAQHREQTVDWLQLQVEEANRQREALAALEEQLNERTRWLQIQSDAIKSLEQRIAALESARADAGHTDPVAHHGRASQTGRKP